MRDGTHPEINVTNIERFKRLLERFGHSVTVMLSREQENAWISAVGASSEARCRTGLW